MHGPFALARVLARALALVLALAFALRLPLALGLATFRGGVFAVAITLALRARDATLQVDRMVPDGGRHPFVDPPAIAAQSKMMMANRPLPRLTCGGIRIVVVGLHQLSSTTASVEPLFVADELPLRAIRILPESVKGGEACGSIRHVPTDPPLRVLLPKRATPNVHAAHVLKALHHH